MLIIRVLQAVCWQAVFSMLARATQHAGKGWSASWQGVVSKRGIYIPQMDCLTP